MTIRQHKRIFALVMMTYMVMAITWARWLKCIALLDCELAINGLLILSAISVIVLILYGYIITHYANK